MGEWIARDLSPTGQKLEALEREYWGDEEYEVMLLGRDNEHLDGIPWHEAQKPFWLHRCRPQTRGYLNYLTYIERCACGALRYDRDRFWIEKNSRRKGR